MFLQVVVKPFRYLLDTVQRDFGTLVEPAKQHSGFAVLRSVFGS
ncbi:MAG: hypothetical protein VW891_13130 [Novosphingobium sp.]